MNIWKVYFLILLSTISTMAQINYPNPNKEIIQDTIHGSLIEDPYRWMEKEHSKPLNRWIKEENKITQKYLSKIKYVKEFRNLLNQSTNFERFSLPFKNQNYYYFFKNNGLQNQDVLYRQLGKNGQPEIFLDPNSFSIDGTTKLVKFSISKNGLYAVIGMSKAGSDWQTLYIMDMMKGEYLKDQIEWVKVSDIAWYKNGFYYSRYPAPKEDEILSDQNQFHQVYFHQVGTDQSSDKLIFEDSTQSQRFYTVTCSEDERYAFLTISDRGKGLDGNALWYKKNSLTRQKFRPIIQDPSDHFYSVIGLNKNELFILTNENAPNNKIQRLNLDPSQLDKRNDLITNQPEVIENVSIAKKQLFVNYLSNVHSQVKVYDLNGSFIQDVNLPGIGIAYGFENFKRDASTYFSYSSFNFPPTIYEYDVKTNQSKIFKQSDLSYDPNEFEVKQVSYPSKDGTEIPMFLVAKKGVLERENNPTLLYGYGGFNISILPSFNSSIIPWLQKEGVYAVANIRGGGEFGENWHRQGMKTQKQHVFDDFIAASDYLVDNKITSRENLAITGRSNGGLLIGACINQKPDMAAVAVPGVGVMDMLRFHLFTIGWNWKPDYGDIEIKEEFEALKAYSPLHNIKNQDYPATLIYTSDHDDRVVPAHSFKYAATLQEKNTSDKPILIRIDVNSGHGSSNISKYLDLMADVYGFIWQEFKK